MEEPSYCNLSLAVDCTLSLGSTTLRTNEIPARLSRAGSPDQDLTWSLAVRSGDPARRTCEEPEQAMSWGGSCCNRSDPDVSADYCPQVWPEQYFACWFCSRNFSGRSVSLFCSLWLNFWHCGYPGFGDGRPRQRWCSEWGQGMATNIVDVVRSASFVQGRSQYLQGSL